MLTELHTCGVMRLEDKQAAMSTPPIQLQLLPCFNTVELQTDSETMTGVTLCEACKAFFRGSHHRATGRRVFPLMHHETAGSFRLANELGCEICMRLRATFVEQDRQQREQEHVRDREASPRLEVDGTIAWGPTSYAVHWSISHAPWLNFGFVNALNESPPIVRLMAGRIESTQPPKHLGCRNTGEHQAIAFAQTQYNDCLREHDKCRSSLESPGFLPTRLLQIHGAKTSSVRLCESAEIPSGVQYTTLSHCWGQAQPTVLTKSTEKGLRHGVLKDTLPLTFQQAIEVATAFSISYLWIDSMCIFQDNLDDWESEASLMQDVYRNAAFCIAATAAKDGTHGLFQDRDCLSFDPVQVMATWDYGTEDGEVFEQGRYWCMVHPVTPIVAIDRAPLNQRAWVAQERFLSRRTIHFTQNLLFWECCENFTNETYPGECFPCDCTVEHTSPRPLKRLVNDTRFYQRAQAGHICHSRTSGSTDIPAIHKVYDAWENYRNFYTQCQLTKESDILAALRGVSSEVGELLDDKLVFGLWTGRLVNDLAWVYNSPGHRVKDKSSSWRAPSWSWTKSVRPNWKVITVAHDMVHIVKFPVETKSPGNVHLYSIIMRCRLITSSVTYSFGIHPCTPYHNKLSVVGTIGPPRLCDMLLFLDDMPETDIMQNNMGGYMAEYQLLILRHNDQELGCLLVVLRDEPTKTYERIGFCLVRDPPDRVGEPGAKSVSDILDIHNTSEDQEIQLI